MIKTIVLGAEESTSVIGTVDSRLNLAEQIFRLLVTDLFPVRGEAYQHFIETGFIDPSTADKANKSAVWKTLPRNHFDGLIFDLARELIVEIKTKRVEGNTMYFDYLSEVLTRHFNFLTKHFESALRNYFGRKDEPKLKLSYQRGRPFVQEKAFYTSGIDFLQNISCRYLFVFEELESLVYQNYPEYKRLLIDNNSICLNKAVDNLENKNVVIALSDLQIESLYSELNGVFIECDFDSFSRILRNESIDRAPILWIDKGDNKLVNKATLIKFVNRIIAQPHGSGIINHFILNFFSTGDTDKHVAVRRRNLNEARRAMKNSGGSKKSVLLDQILLKVLGKPL